MNGKRIFRNKLLSCLVTAALVMALMPSLALAATAGSLIPEPSIWGISRDDLKKQVKAEYSDIKVAKSQALKREGLEAEGYPLEAWYVFGDDVTDATGYSYHGLSKIAFIWAGTDKRPDEALDACYQALVEGVMKQAGAPSSTEKAVTTWDMGTYKIEIGKGKFKNYNGSSNVNVAVIITAVDHGENVTPRPTVEPTPRPTTKEEGEAVQTAKALLDAAGFSQDQLVAQLKYEGFSDSVSKYAVENCGADWDQQATRSAENYRSYLSLSGDELVAQLEKDGFTHEQAVKAAG